MDRQIKNADYVLMICTSTYYKRVICEEKTGVGLGGIWEGTLKDTHVRTSSGGVPLYFLFVISLSANFTLGKRCAYFE